MVALIQTFHGNVWVSFLIYGLRNPLREKNPLRLVPRRLPLPR